MAENDRDHHNALVASLKACARKKDLGRGALLHAHMLERGSLLLQEKPYIASNLIHMYSSCGELGRARRVLEALPVRDLVSWSALISGYTRHGLASEALRSFERMQREGICPDAVA
jgi:pentatricopeptide repeat protein